MSITEQLNKLAEQEKALKVRQKKLQKKQLENEQKRKIKFHVFIDEPLFVEICNLEGKTTFVEIINNEDIVEDVEMVITKKSLITCARRIIKNAFDRYR